MYTQADIDAVDNAIAALAKGERVTRFRTANGKVFEFQSSSLQELKETRAEMVRALNRQNGTKRRNRTRRAFTSKGL
ncbi:MAG: hypothetical protein AAF662_02260 [Pseudomonadota bacterium]